MQVISPRYWHLDQKDNLAAAHSAGEEQVQPQNSDVRVFLCSYSGAVAMGASLFSAFAMAWPFIIQDHDDPLYPDSLSDLLVPIFIFVVSFVVLIIPTIAIYVGLQYLRMVSLVAYLATALILPILMILFFLMDQPDPIESWDFWFALELMLILASCTLAGAYVFHRIEMRMRKS